MSRPLFTVPALFVAPALALGLAAAAPLPAAAAAPPKVETPAALHATDLYFVLEAARGGMAEVTLGNLAEEKATVEDVKHFARQMVADHTKANQELAQIASAKGTTPPKEADPEVAAMRQTMAALAAPGFDKEYMAQQIAAHEVTIALFEAEAAGSEDPELKGFARTTLPKLKEHLRMAKDALTAARQHAANR